MVLDWRIVFRFTGDVFAGRFHSVFAAMWLMSDPFLVE